MIGIYLGVGTLVVVLALVEIRKAIDRNTQVLVRMQQDMLDYRTAAIYRIDDIHRTSNRLARFAEAVQSRGMLVRME